jgi:hypothetical protein
MEEFFSRFFYDTFLCFSFIQFFFFHALLKLSNFFFASCAARLAVNPKKVLGNVYAPGRQCADDHNGLDMLVKAPGKRAV